MNPTLMYLLGGALLCFLVSGTSSDVFRGAILPLIGIALLLIAAVKFIAERVQGSSQGNFHYTPTPEELRVLAEARVKLAAEQKAQAEAAAKQQTEYAARLAAAKDQPQGTKAVFNLGDDTPKK